MFGKQKTTELHKVCDPKFVNYIKSVNPNSQDFWRCLSCNTHPRAIQFLEENFHKIDWEMLSANRGAVHLLEKYPNKINWFWISLNPNAIHLVKEHLSKDQLEGVQNKNNAKVSWKQLSRNPNALELLKENTDKIDWNSLSGNTNPKVLEMLDITKITDTGLCLSSNPSATKILKENPKYINWEFFAKNPHDDAAHMLMDAIEYELKRDMETSDDDGFIPCNFKVTTKSTYLPYTMSENTNPIVLKQLFDSKYPINPEFTILSANPAPIVSDYLSNNIDKIHLPSFLTNPLLFGM